MLPMLTTSRWTGLMKLYVELPALRTTWNLCYIMFEMSALLSNADSSTNVLRGDGRDANRSQSVSAGTSEARITHRSANKPTRQRELDHLVISRQRDDAPSGHEVVRALVAAKHLQQDRYARGDKLDAINSEERRWRCQVL